MATQKVGMLVPFWLHLVGVMYPFWASISVLLKESRSLPWRRSALKQDFIVVAFKIKRSPWRWGVTWIIEVRGGGKWATSILLLLVVVCFLTIFELLFSMLSLLSLPVSLPKLSVHISKLLMLSLVTCFSP